MSGNSSSSILSDKDKLSIDAAKLYYQSNKSQQEVADLLGVSRPTVSKLLQHASENKFVVITINDPRDNYAQLAKMLKERYKLSSVHISPTPPDNNKVKLQENIGELGARLLEKTVHNNDIVGVEWSHTIHAMAQALKPQLFQNVQVVQLRGSEIKARQGLNESETINKISQCLNAKGQLLPLPIVFEDIKTKNLIQRESSIWKVLENGIQSRIAVFTVSSLSQESVLFTSGFYTHDEMSILHKRSVGSICARFVDENGRVCLPDLNNRTIGITLPDLRHKEERILIAGGINKVRVIHVALQYGYANHLVTDALTANLLLEFSKKM